MTTPTEAVNTVLKSHAGLQALVGNGDSPETYRIYAILMPQDPTTPAVTFNRISGVRVPTLTDAGGNGVENSRIRVTSWATTLASAQAVAEQARQALMAATTFKTTQVIDFDAFEADTLLYSVTSDYSIWYKY